MAKKQKMQFPTEEASIRWANQVRDTYPEYLVEALCERPVVEAQWAALLEYLGQPPIREDEALGVVLDSFTQWVTVYQPVYGKIMPGYLDLFFPLLMTLRGLLTLENAVDVVADFPAYLHGLTDRLEHYYDADGPLVMKGYELALRRRQLENA